MPCRSDHMEATAREIEGSRVLTFLEEIKRGTPPSPSYLRGYHPDTDEKTAELCELCQKNDTTAFSLELQMWWRDHQASEERRALEDADDLRRKDLRQSGLAKLTPDEREALKLHSK